MFITAQLMFILFYTTLPNINNCRWLSPNVGPVEQLSEKKNLLKLIKEHQNIMKTLVTILSRANDKLKNCILKTSKKYYKY